MERFKDGIIHNDRSDKKVDDEKIKSDLIKGGGAVAVLGAMIAEVLHTEAKEKMTRKETLSQIDRAKKR